MKKTIYISLLLSIDALFGMDSVASGTQLVAYRRLFEALAQARSIDYPQNDWIESVSDKAKAFYSERVLDPITNTVYLLDKGSRNISVTCQNTNEKIEFSIDDFKREIKKVY